MWHVLYKSTFSLRWNMRPLSLFALLHLAVVVIQQLCKNRELVNKVFCCLLCILYIVTNYSLSMCVNCFQQYSCSPMWCSLACSQIVWILDWKRLQCCNKRCQVSVIFLMFCLIFKCVNKPLWSCMAFVRIKGLIPDPIIHSPFKDETFGHKWQQLNKYSGIKCPIFAFVCCRSKNYFIFAKRV